MNWFSMIKLAKVKYMYHGTGIQNLPRILSEGLRTDTPKNYDNPLEYNSIRSYGGIYLTENFMTAYTSASKSTNEKDHKVIIMTKIETKTPHVIIDEDNLTNPIFIISKHMGGYNIDQRTNPEVMVYFIEKELPQKIDDIINDYVSFLNNSYNQMITDKAQNHLKPYIKEWVKATCMRMLAAQYTINYKTHDDWSSKYHKERFDKLYPEYKDLDIEKYENQYRNISDVLMRKAHRLTDFESNKIFNNIRSMENITYRGKNKIVMVSECIHQSSADSPYYEKINIVYLSDPECVNIFLSDMRRHISSNLIAKYKDQILYNNPEKKTIEKTGQHTSQDTEFDIPDYPIVSGTISGLYIRPNVPNMLSIEATIPHPIILDGIREVPMSAFVLDTDTNITNDEYVKDLASQIKENQEINPLIVGYDSEGPYIIEGAHRYDALKYLGKKSFPAIVAIDTEM
ncbi:MAG: ParB N-terminal domain-containing protein [Elusimicrobiota bacterium]